MNHTDLMNRFWRLDEVLRFSANETRLYLLLLDTLCRVGLDRSLTWTNCYAMGVLGISLNAFRNACQSLASRGLIYVNVEMVKRRHLTTLQLAIPDTETPDTEAPEPVDDEPQTRENPAPADVPTEPEKPADPVIATTSTPTAVRRKPINNPHKTKPHRRLASPYHKRARDNKPHKIPLRALLHDKYLAHRH